MTSPLNILVLCNRPIRGADAPTITDHLDAFARFSRHRITSLSFVGDLPAGVDLSRFDVLVAHYTVPIGFPGDHFVSARARARLRAYKGLKVAFVQDEYRAVNLRIEALGSTGFDVLFTCVPQSEIGKVYPADLLPGLRVVTNLTGYVPDGLLDVPVAPIAERRIDLGYRTRQLPYWLGELAYRKWRIAEEFADATRDAGLAIDASSRESDRLYGRGWIHFVASCRAMLGTESGASVFDFDGSIEARVDAYMRANPEASFATVRAKILEPHEGLIRLNQISPRCFEAAALRTAMVLLEGDYSEILVPRRHYMPLAHDLGNIGEVVDFLRDPARMQAMADCAFAEIARNPAFGYQTLIERFDETVAEEFAARAKTPAAQTYSRTSFYLDLARSPSYVVRQASARPLQRLLLGTSLRRVVFGLWDRIPAGLRRGVRPLLRLIGR